MIGHVCALLAYSAWWNRMNGSALPPASGPTWNTTDHVLAPFPTPIVGRCTSTNGPLLPRHGRTRRQNLEAGHDLGVRGVEAGFVVGVACVL